MQRCSVFGCSLCSNVIQHLKFVDHLSMQRCSVIGCTSSNVFQHLKYVDHLSMQRCSVIGCSLCSNVFQHLKYVDHLSMQGCSVIGCTSSNVFQHRKCVNHISMQGCSGIGRSLCSHVFQFTNFTLALRQLPRKPSDPWSILKLPSCGIESAWYKVLRCLTATSLPP